MRKQIVLICLSIFLIISTIQAGEISKKGIKVGLNYSNIIFEYAEFDNRTGLIAGVFFTYQLNNNISFQPELLFSMKGFKSIQQGSDMSGNIKSYESIYELNYLELPILASYNVSVYKAIKSSVFIGPYFAYKLSSKINYPKELIDLYGSLESEWEYPKNVDFGFIVGAGVSYKLLSLEVCYSLGLTSIDGFRAGDGGKADMKNRVTSIVLGLFF